MSAEKHFPTYAELLARTDAPAGSAWGLFGPDDELGTLNHLTPERVREAVGVVRTGEVVNLNLPLEAFDPPVSPFRKSLQHNIYANNPSHRDEYLDSFYPQASTQLDGFRHIGHPEFGFYNGADPDRFQPRDPFLGINRFVEHGIVGRGVLVDVDRFRRAQGRPIDHAAAEAIPITDVADAAAEQGVEFRPGDVLLVRTGWVHHHLYELTPSSATKPRTRCGRRACSRATTPSPGSGTTGSRCSPPTTSVWRSSPPLRTPRSSPRPNAAATCRAPCTRASCTASSSACWDSCSASSGTWTVSQSVAPVTESGTAWSSPARST